MSEPRTSERLVANRYRLIRPLGSGGMGTVWRAHDEVLDRDVAVKEVLTPPELSDEDIETFTKRTFREARAAGRVSHPGVATVYDVFEEAGNPWIVLELVPSRTLGSALRENGPLSPREVAEIGLQVLAALRAAHTAGVLHRDVKPDNVLLADGGRAVLTDFGIATLEDESAVTKTGALIGTPAFIAPERAAGGGADRASDLWSLGVTMYVAVEGRSPFHRGHALATMAAVLYEKPAPLRRAGPLAPIIEGLLHKDPAERLTTGELEPWLRNVAEGLPPEPTLPHVVVPFAATPPVPGTTAPAVPATAVPGTTAPTSGGPPMAAPATGMPPTAAPTSGGPPMAVPATGGPAVKQRAPGTGHGPEAASSRDRTARSGWVAGGVAPPGAGRVVGDVPPLRRGRVVGGVAALTIIVGLTTGGLAYVTADAPEGRGAAPAVIHQVTAPPATTHRSPRPATTLSSRPLDTAAPRADPTRAPEGATTAGRASAKPGKMKTPSPKPTKTGKKPKPSTSSTGGGEPGGRVEPGSVAAVQDSARTVSKALARSSG